MDSDSLIERANQVFATIFACFPELQVVRNENTPVEISYTIPAQDGLDHDVHLNLQNEDELHLEIGRYFWMEWFPVSDQAQADQYIDAVCGFLAGEYRVEEYYRGKTCVKANLQKRGKGGAWESIETWTVLHIPLPWQKKSTTILKNSAR